MYKEEYPDDNNDIITILLLIGGSICVAIPSSQALNVTGSLQVQD